jgi:hypothetical protein
MRGTDASLEGVERRAVPSGDKHELDKFNVMLAADFTCYISPKGQTKGEWVNHLKSL